MNSCKFFNILHDSSQTDFEKSLYQNIQTRMNREMDNGSNIEQQLGVMFENPNWNTLSNLILKSQKQNQFIFNEKKRMSSSFQKINRNFSSLKKQKIEKSLSVEKNFKFFHQLQQKYQQKKGESLTLEISSCKCIQCGGENKKDKNLASYYPYFLDDIEKLQLPNTNPISPKCIKLQVPIMNKPFGSRRSIVFRKSSRSSGSDNESIKLSIREISQDDNLSQMDQICSKVYVKPQKLHEKHEPQKRIHALKAQIQIIMFQRFMKKILFEKEQRSINEVQNNKEKLFKSPRNDNHSKQNRYLTEMGLEENTKYMLSPICSGKPIIQKSPIQKCSLTKLPSIKQKYKKVGGSSIDQYRQTQKPSFNNNIADIIIQYKRTETIQEAPLTLKRRKNYTFNKIHSVYSQHNDLKSVKKEMEKFKQSTDDTFKSSQIILKKKVNHQIQKK